MTIDRKLSDQDIYTVMWRRRQNVAMRDIAAELGCSMSTVARVVYQEGAYAGYVAPTGELTDELIAIIRDEPAGISYASLADKYMLSQSTAMRVWRGEGRFTVGRFSDIDIVCKMIADTKAEYEAQKAAKKAARAKKAKKTAPATGTVVKFNLKPATNMTGAKRGRGRAAVANQMLADAVRRMYGNGTRHTYQSVADKMGVSPATVGRIVTRIGAYAEKKADKKAA